ncbi:MAG: hypothetical protein CML78_04740 [Rhodobiaceae bacterium]|nr:hypothetical protein [Rhodobiaceae bacterium]RPF94694.1 MAG: HupE/UreJ family protein [Rhizobiales bacterium TMED162]
MLRGVFAFLVLAMVALTPSMAHNKSLSFSDWFWDGKTLQVSFTAPARDVTLLPEVVTSQNLAQALSIHVEKHLRLVQVNTPCRLERGFETAPAHDGYVRVTGRFGCFNDTTPIEMHNHAFFNLARSHVHFARLSLQEKPELGGAEILFTATQRMHRIAPGEEGRIETGVRFGEIFSSHFWLGIEHIVTGYDHLAFVFCLLLIGGTRRQSLLLITGFTIGHSLTLALAVLGVVRADPQMVEALIGFSIALVAAERILARNRLMPLTGMAAAGAFFVLSFIFTFTQSGFASDIGLGVWAGLILFCLAYGLVIRDEADTLKLAPLMTLAFGLIHGFGFAGLLSDIGLPPDNVAGALFGFNIGIEIGQLLVFVPLVVFGPYLLEEVPTPPIKWADIAALMLTVLGVFLFVSRLII